MQSINVINEKIIINYTHLGTSFSLNIDVKSLELVYSSVLILIDNRYKSQKYKDGLLRKYYDEINDNIKNLNSLNDDIGNTLAGISNEIRLKRIVRHKLINPKYTINKDNITIEKYNYDYPEYYSADYLIEHEVIKYLVPDEVLNNSGEISLDKLKDWIF